MKDSGRLHADDRIKHGFTFRSVLAEFRALRATVLRRYEESGATDLSDVRRFNESIDEAMVESMDRIAAQGDLFRDQFIGIRAVCEAVVDENRVARPEALLRLQTRGNLIGTWDADRLAQLISNLITNAIQHGAGTPVTVIAEEDGNAVTLAVHNGGAPIAQELWSSVFEPLARGKTDDGLHNIGLGLFIARAIVSAHGGDIDVRSSAELGTTFTARLPKSERSSLTMAQVSDRLVYAIPIHRQRCDLDSRGPYTRWRNPDGLSNGTRSSAFTTSVQRSALSRGRRISRKPSGRQPAPAHHRLF